VYLDGTGWLPPTCQYYFDSPDYWLYQQVYRIDSRASLYVSIPIPYLVHDDPKALADALFNASVKSTTLLRLKLAELPPSETPLVGSPINPKTETYKPRVGV